METTFSKLWEAFKPIEAWAKTVNFDAPGNLGANEWSKGPRPEGGTRLRIDAVTPVDLNQEQQLYLVWLQVKGELIDLITYGDVNHINDALYKSLDGEVKRGRSVDAINIPRCAVYREYKTKNSTYEYVVYLILETVYTD